MLALGTLLQLGQAHPQAPAVHLCPAVAAVSQRSAGPLVRRRRGFLAEKHARAGSRHGAAARQALAPSPEKLFGVQEAEEKHAVLAAGWHGAAAGQALPNTPFGVQESALVEKRTCWHPARCCRWAGVCPS